MKIVLLGSGNVATHLGQGLLKGGHRILQVAGRNEAAVRRLAKKLHALPVTEGGKSILKADLYLLAVSDNSIRKVSAWIPYRDAVVVHTSGAVSLGVLQKNFPFSGVVYPVQTFSLHRKTTISEIPFCIESSSPR